MTMTMTTDIQPPTTRLPPIATIGATLATGTTTLLNALDYLGVLYRPQVRGSRIIRRRAHPNDGSRLGERKGGDGDGDHTLIQCIQSDVFERRYAIRWLMALIAQLETRREWSPSPPLTPPPTSALVSTSQSDLSITISGHIEADTLVEQAASLLAICAGVAAAGKVQRRFTFRSPLIKLDAQDDKYTNEAQMPGAQIDVFLTDLPLDNQDYASVGVQTWGGACVLAEMIAEHPDRFGLFRGPTLNGSRSSVDSHGPLRILELGSGTGLVGLTIAKLIFASLSQNPSKHHTRAIIVLTDFYPAVLTNLQSNIVANVPPASVSSNPPDKSKDTGTEVYVRCHFLDWSSFPDAGTKTTPDILSTPFDVIFGADVVYEAQHAVWIRDCLVSLLARPSESPESSNEDTAQDSSFHLVIPLRPTHTLESNTVEAVFGTRTRGLDDERRECELAILSKEFIVCEAYGGHVDEDVEYVYYRIGWSW